ncbi:MAG: hypothetical protein PW788_13780 [Micavibrio sp.]|nr:hypothetical protein [Micavibrio sp.]
MKIVRLTCRILIVLTALMVWQAKTADAHGLENHAAYSEATTSQQAIPSGVTKSFQQELTASISNQSEEKSCDGTCCFNSTCCCPAALSTTYIAAHFKIASLVEPVNLGYMTQGPPYFLLRPPKHSA